MITSEEAIAAMLSLAALPYFPTDGPAREKIADLLTRLCRNSAELEWLVRRTIDLWSKWEGPRELRAVYCARFKPQDGIDAISSIFPEGIVPPEKPLPAFQPIALPPGAVVSADKEMESATLQVAAERDIQKHLRDMSPHQRRAEHRVDQVLENIEIGPPDREEVPLERKPPVTPQYITPADVEAAIAAKPDRKDELIRQAQETLADPKATIDAKWIAREILRGLGASA